MLPKLTFVCSTPALRRFTWQVYPTGANCSAFVLANARFRSLTVPIITYACVADCLPSFVSESFQRVVLYDVPVHMSRHPLLCEYIHSALSGCRQWILSAELDKLSVVALSEAGRTVKTLVIEPGVDLSVVDAVAGKQGRGLPLLQLEEVFRTALVSIVSTPLTVKRGDPGDKPASFRILVHTIEDSARPLTAVDGADAGNSWVLADQLWRGELSQQRSVFPVKTVQSADCPVKINVYMETPDRSGDGNHL